MYITYPFKSNNIAPLFLIGFPTYPEKIHEVYFSRTLFKLPSLSWYDNRSYDYTFTHIKLKLFSHSQYLCFWKIKGVILLIHIKKF